MAMKEAIVSKVSILASVSSFDCLFVEVVRVKLFLVCLYVWFIRVFVRAFTNHIARERVRGPYSITQTRILKAKG